jgi:hypothetical protein
MESKRLSALDLQHKIEHQAYVYGVSPAVSVLLSEYVIELIRQTYVRHTEKQLVPSAIGQN